MPKTWNFELQMSYVPQKKAENMDNSYSGWKKKIFFKENYIFLKILIFHRRVPLWIGNLQYFPKKFGNLKNEFAGTSLV